MPEERTTSTIPSQTSSPGSHLRDKRKLPEGVVPRQAQSYLIAGLALLILLAVLFSKNHARTAPQKPAPPPADVSNSTNQQKIRELEQDLNAAQQQSEQQIQSRKASSVDSASDAAVSSQTSLAAPVPQPPQHDPIADAEKALAFKARFVSNLVVPADASNSAVASPLKKNNPLMPDRHDPSPSQASAAQSADGSSKRAPEVNIDAAHGRPYVLFEGTTIDTVVTNRLDGDFAGPVKVMVTNPVYSRDGQHVLIPAGTFLLGSAEKVSSLAQKRLAVAFHRMVMPDGYSVGLDLFHGLDQIGDTGLKDKVNHHYLRIFGASIALGVIAGAAEATTTGGYAENGSDIYRQGMASSLSQSGASVLDRFINVPPTITIREGHRIKVYLTQDLLLPAYENHDMPPEM